MRLPDFGKCGLFIAMLLAVAGLRAQTVIEPARKGNTAFAVIVDSMTYVECAPQIGSYGKTLEEEGLPTFIVYKNWKAPEEVREVLRNLYEREKLEGAVFVGDIPIPMITKAQHLTSAFKMDERKHPLREASVPSDRFYEDFDLKFIPIPDSTQGLLFFYQLAPASPQFITSDIYSGRIKAQKSNGDPYAQIAAYLEKAVKAHRENNRLDQVVSYTGDGSYSNSLTAWRAEQQIMNEQFGDMFTRQRGLKFLRYSMAPYMKDYIIKELRRDDLDLMVFHEHGMPNRQYLTGDPETFDFDTHMESVKEYLRGMVRRDREKADPFARARAEADRLGVDSSWYRNALTPEMLLRDSLTDLRKGIVLEDVNGIRPNARFVISMPAITGIFGKTISSPENTFLRTGNAWRHSPTASTCCRTSPLSICWGCWDAAPGSAHGRDISTSWNPTSSAIRPSGSHLSSKRTSTRFRLTRIPVTGWGGWTIRCRTCKIMHSSNCI